ncbi:hypothetical protein [Curtobacterium sp. ME12]|uniref:hypothetical protein n=1 Tax=Curtobacterium sp. ME12 TaxID=2744253 RepID=UPI0015F72DD3|nr:hypothetical protein [Curtobacterium sp. ME12]
MSREEAFRYALGVWKDRSRRGLALAALSIPGSVVMAGWKLILFCAAPSLLIAATVLFNLGVAAVKFFAVHRHRRSVALFDDEQERARFRQRGYRWIGLSVLLLGLLFVGASMPLLTGRAHVTLFGKWPAIIIATATFSELGISIWGAVTARRDREPLVEATKLVNVAAAVVLLVLTQAALLSLGGSTDAAATFNGASGVFLGGVAAAIGALMVLRRFPVNTTLDTGSRKQAALERKRD